MHHSFFDQAPVGCLVLDPDGRIRDVNPTAARRLGRDRDDLRGQSLTQFVRPSDTGRLAACLQAARSSADTCRADLTFHRPGTPDDHACLVCNAARDAAGTVLQIQAVLLDVAAPDAATDALPFDERRLRRIIVEAPLPVAIHTERGEILALSRVWTEATGFGLDEFPTLDAWMDRMKEPRHPGDGSLLLQKLADRLFEENTRVHIGEWTIRTRGGERRVWDLHAAPLARLSGGRRVVITMAIDVTEHKRIETELAHARDRAEEMARLKSSFLANMSHEIRTPLTGIIGFASVLAREVPDEQREFAELIEGSGRRLLDLLNSVLDLARLDSNQIKLEPARIDLAEECRHVVQLFEPAAREKDLALTLETDLRQTHALLDRSAFTRVLHNLVGNAVKFTDEGHVVLHLETSDDRVRLRVVDSGIGIDEAFRPFLFDEFRQESSGVSRSHGGSGLGLAITKRLVELMGGTITVESQRGVGTTFTVDLPGAIDDPGRGRSTTSCDNEAAGVDGERMRLLLVEDQLDTQYLLFELLEDCFDLSIAGNAAEALELARSQSFDVVLLDIQLGEGPDGTEVLRRLRAMPRYRHTPVVALTAFALPGDRERFLDMGFTEYLSKPFDVDELRRLPGRLLTS